MLLKFKSILSVILLSIPLTCHDAYSTDYTSSSIGKKFDSQEDLNMFVGSRSVELYQKLNSTSRYVDKGKGETPGVSGDYWIFAFDRARNPHLVKKANNTKASEALNQIFENNGNRLECTAALTIVVSKCICEIFGNAKFDTLYETLEKRAKEQGVGFSLANFCASFLIRTPQEPNAMINNSLQSGNVVAIRNLPDYLINNNFGLYNNDNLITVMTDNGEKKFIGFGEEYKNGPVSYADVKEYMLEDYRKTDRYGSRGSIFTHGGEKVYFDLIQNVPTSHVSLNTINNVLSQR